MNRNNRYETELEMLETLLIQHQFEIVDPKLNTGEKSDLRVVYLMNDAVESFLLFTNAVVTGNYDADYEGELEWELTLGKIMDTGMAADNDLPESEQSVLVVHQGDQLCTVFFDELKKDIHLYDYGQTGHLWVKGHEHMRQLEYRLAILRDKRQYLGEEYCTKIELGLADLADFPPLNYSCFPAVPEKYLSPAIPRWLVTEDAIKAMKILVDEFMTGSDEKKIISYAPELKRLLTKYEKNPTIRRAKKMADFFISSAGEFFVDFLTEKIEAGAAGYPRRQYGQEQAQWEKMQAEALTRKNQLESQGHKVRIIYEEPFVYARDSVGFGIYLICDGEVIQ